MLDQLFAKLANQGIGIVVAAGNSNAICTQGSPAEVSSNSLVQSIGALGKKGDPVGYQAGQDLATYSNYSTPAAKCVDEYYQGCYALPDPFTNQVSVGCGTSFASPVGTARRVAYEAANPSSSSAEIKQAMQNDTIPAVGPKGVTVNAITPSLAFNWSNAQKQANAKGFSSVRAEGVHDKHAEQDVKHVARSKNRAHFRAY